MHTSRLLLFVLAFGACVDAPTDQYVTLAKTLDLEAGSWLDVTAPEALLTPGYHHELCFRVAEPFALGEDPMGLIDASGGRVALVASAYAPNETLELSGFSYSGDRNACLGVSQVDLSGSFTGVRLRAAAPLRLHDVRWQSVDK